MFLDENELVDFDRADAVADRLMELAKGQRSEAEELMNDGTLTVDDLRFELRRSPRRRSVQITVDRGGELLLAAPEECSFDTMEAFVREKRFWIYTKLAEKEALWAPPCEKQYVTGEGFPYLGRSSPLLLVDEQEAHRRPLSYAARARQRRPRAYARSPSRPSDGRLAAASAADDRSVASVHDPIEGRLGGEIDPVTGQQGDQLPR